MWVHYAPMLKLKIVIHLICLAVLLLVSHTLYVRIFIFWVLVLEAYPAGLAKARSTN
jgi:hypothetical protein